MQALHHSTPWALSAQSKAVELRRVVCGELLWAEPTLLWRQCTGSAQAVHMQCTAVHWEQSRVVLWALPKHGELPEFHCQLTSALQYPLPYRAFNTHCNMHCILKKKKNTTFDAYCYIYALQYKYLLHYPLQYALHKTRVHTALSTILIPVVHCNALWVLQKYTVM